MMLLGKFTLSLNTEMLYTFLPREYLTRIYVTKKWSYLYKNSILCVGRVNEFKALLVLTGYRNLIDINVNAATWLKTWVLGLSSVVQRPLHHSNQKALLLDGRNGQVGDAYLCGLTICYLSQNTRISQFFEYWNYISTCRVPVMPFYLSDRIVL